MARPKAERAGDNHPARKILEEHTAQEVADALGVKPGTVYAFKRDLHLDVADRIYAAFNSEAAKKAPPRKHKPQYNTQTADEFLRQNEKREQAYDMQKMARTAVSQVTREEFTPAIQELLARLGKQNTPAAYLVIPLTSTELGKLKGGGHD